jgi:tagaturonate epimerase
MNKQSNSSPSLLGLAPSFGFGDRLGLATAGHIAACRMGNFLPIFAQQSVREMARTQRTPNEVMSAAQRGIQEEGWTGPWGADADHLKTKEDVENLAAAGFTFFTIDPSAFVQNQADELTGTALLAAAEDVVRSGAFPSLRDLEEIYLNKAHHLPNGVKVAFTEKETLYRAAVKYGKAVHHAQKMAKWIAHSTKARGAEIEVSVDETDTPTSLAEHLFIGLELKRRGVRAVSLAPRFIGEFEKGIDYKGDLRAFEAGLREHVAVAQYCGPYKISVHSGSDKFSLYPILGRVCGALLHVKTAGTSYLEALRVVARKAPELFLEIIEYAFSRFETDRATYHISAKLTGVPKPVSLSATGREDVFLNQDAGRQILHVTFGSVLTMGRTAKGRAFNEGIIETLKSNEPLHKEVLAAHLGRHIKLLNAG